MPSRRAVQVPSRSALALLRLGLTGALAGSLVAVTGCNWTLWLHEDGLEICDDDYADCMADAQSEADEQWCVTEVQSCYEECEAGWDDEADDQGDQAEEQDEQGNDESTTGSGTTGSSDSSSDTGEIPQACFDLHANCIEQAQTLADVDACEALFDQCANPGECSMCGCPEGALEACLASYSECAEAASSEAEVQTCAADFDACTQPFADLCQVAENPNLETCLDQHGLCVACATSDEQLAACEAVFDSCMVQL